MEKILRNCLYSLGQEDHFDRYCDYLRSEWLYSVQDLSLATKDPSIWSALQLPARLKLEILKALAEYDNNNNAYVEEDSYVAEESQQYGYAEATTPALIWMRCFSVEYNCDYYYNTTTEESSWEEPAEGYYDDPDYYNYDQTNEYGDENRNSYNSTGEGELVFLKPKTPPPTPSKSPLLFKSTSRRSLTATPSRQSSRRIESDEDDSVDDDSKSIVSDTMDDTSTSSESSRHFIISEGDNSKIRVESYKIPSSASTEKDFNKKKSSKGDKRSSTKSNRESIEFSHSKLYPLSSITDIQEDNPYSSTSLYSIDESLAMEKISLDYHDSALMNRRVKSSDDEYMCSPRQRLLSDSPDGRDERKLDFPVKDSPHSPPPTAPPISSDEDASDKNGQSLFDRGIPTHDDQFPPHSLPAPPPKGLNQDELLAMALGMPSPPPTTRSNDSAQFIDAMASPMPPSTPIEIEPVPSPVVEAKPLKKPKDSNGLRKLFPNGLFRMGKGKSNAHKYALPDNVVSEKLSQEEKVHHLTQMGFEERAAEMALNMANGSLYEASSILMESENG